MFLSYAACHFSLRSPCFVSSELCCFFCWISCLCFLKDIPTAERFIKILLLKILCCLCLFLVPTLFYSASAAVTLKACANLRWWQAKLNNDINTLMLLSVDRLNTDSGL